MAPVWYVVPGHGIRDSRRGATAVLGGVLVLLGLLSCSFGALVLASIPRSDTATGSLVVFALEFLVPGLAAVGTGAWLLRRARLGSDRRVSR